MKFNLSQKDINFIQPLWKFLNIFLVTPHYNFDKNVAKHPILSKLFGIVFVIARIFWIGTVLQNSRQTEMWNLLVFTQKFSYILGLFQLILLNLLVIIKSSFLIDVKAWKLLFKNLQYIDIKLQNKGKTESRIWKNFYFNFVIKIVFFTAFFTYQLYGWSSFLKITFFQSLQTGPMFDVLYEFLIFMFFTCIVQLIKQRYKNLNNKLLTLQKSTKMIQELQLFVQIYRILGETIEIFNKLFGYQNFIDNIPHRFATSFLSKFSCSFFKNHQF